MLLPYQYQTPLTRMSLFQMQTPIQMLLMRMSVVQSLVWTAQILAQMTLTPLMRMLRPLGLSTQVCILWKMKE